MRQNLVHKSFQHLKDSKVVVPLKFTCKTRNNVFTKEKLISNLHCLKITVQYTNTWMMQQLFCLKECKFEGKINLDYHFVKITVTKRNHKKDLLGFSRNRKTFREVRSLTLGFKLAREYSLS